MHEGHPVDPSKVLLGGHPAQEGLKTALLVGRNGVISNSTTRTRIGELFCGVKLYPKMSLGDALRKKSWWHATLYLYL